MKNTGRPLSDARQTIIPEAGMQNPGITIKVLLTIGAGAVRIFMLQIVAVNVWAAGFAAKKEAAGEQ